MSQTSPSAAGLGRIIGGVFAVAGVVGFIPNPLVGEEGVFVTNGAHNFVHIATAALFFAISMMGDRASMRLMQVFGVVYLLVGIAGFVVLGGASETMLLGVIHINQLDNFLHLGLGLGIAAAGFFVQRSLAVAA